jgi:hypothetical protein
MQPNNLFANEATAIRPRMTEKQVRERLSQIVGLEIANEIYSLGQSMANEIIGSIRALESKATLFAAYGTGIVTFLVSSSATWSNLGNLMRCVLDWRRLYAPSFLSKPWL